MPTLKLWIENLAADDEAAVSREIRALDGVFFAVANHRDQCMEIDFEDDRVSSDRIVATLAGLGYVARLAG
jgi:copper chaperone CopZ